MTKERAESLSLEHEAGVVGVGRDSAEGVFGTREVQVFFGADGEFDVFVHVVVVGVVASSVGVVGHGCLLWERGADLMWAVDTEVGRLGCGVFE